VQTRMQANAFQKKAAEQKTQKRHFLDFGFPQPHFTSATLCEAPWTQIGKLCYSPAKVRAPCCPPLPLCCPPLHHAAPSHCPARA
jgi:hypothetical protein